MLHEADTYLFTSRWIPSTEGFFDFVKSYRKIINCPLGGTRKLKHEYSNPVLSHVLSVGTSDNRSSLPQRISLSNFLIGSPITSYGCILRCGEGENAKYLLVKRNDSVGYIDFVRGNYRESQLFFMLKSLPNHEREKILQYNFDELWHDLHRKPAEGEMYKFGKKMYDKIIPHIPKLFLETPSQDPQGKHLWLFPKGRPNYKVSEQTPRESPFECALREFKEETNGLELKEEMLLFPTPLVEKFLGSNSKNYQTNYFVFQVDEKIDIHPFETIHTGIREVSTGEVGNICWVSYKHLSNYLRPNRLCLVEHIQDHIPNSPARKVDELWKHPLEINEIYVDRDE